MNSAVPQPNEAILARGHDLSTKIAAIEAEVQRWIAELPASNTETVVAQIHGNRALIALQQAKVEIGTLALTASQI